MADRNFIVNYIINAQTENAINEFKRFNSSVDQLNEKFSLMDSSLGKMIATANDLKKAINESVMPPAVNSKSWSVAFKPIENAGVGAANRIKAAFEEAWAVVNGGSGKASGASSATAAKIKSEIKSEKVTAEQRRDKIISSLKSSANKSLLADISAIRELQSARDELKGSSGAQKLAAKLKVEDILGRYNFEDIAKLQSGILSQIFGKDFVLGKEKNGNVRMRFTDTGMAAITQFNKDMAASASTATQSATAAGDRLGQLVAAQKRVGELVNLGGKGFTKEDKELFKGLGFKGADGRSFPFVDQFGVLKNSMAWQAKIDQELKNMKGKNTRMDATKKIQESLGTASAQRGIAESLPQIQGSGSSLIAGVGETGNGSKTPPQVAPGKAQQQAADANARKAVGSGMFGDMLTIPFERLQLFAKEYVNLRNKINSGGIKFSIAGLTADKIAMLERFTKILPTIAQMAPSGPIDYRFNFDVAGLSSQLDSAIDTAKAKIAELNAILGEVATKAPKVHEKAKKQAASSAKKISKDSTITLTPIINWALLESEIAAKTLQVKVNLIPNIGGNGKNGNLTAQLDNLISQTKTKMSALKSILTGSAMPYQAGMMSRRDYRKGWEDLLAIEDKINRTRSASKRAQLQSQADALRAKMVDQQMMRQGLAEQTRANRSLGLANQFSVMVTPRINWALLKAELDAKMFDVKVRGVLTGDVVSKGGTKTLNVKGVIKDLVWGRNANNKLVGSDKSARIKAIISGIKTSQAELQRLANAKFKNVSVSVNMKPVWGLKDDQGRTLRGAAARNKLFKAFGQTLPQMEVQLSTKQAEAAIDRLIAKIKANRIIQIVGGGGGGNYGGGGGGRYGRAGDGYYLSNLPSQRAERPWNKLGYQLMGNTSFGARTPVFVDMMKGMGVMMGVGAVFGTVTDALKQAMSYQNTMKTAEMIFRDNLNGGYAPAKFRSAEVEARQVAARTKFTAPQTAEAMRFFAMAGLDVDTARSAIAPIADVSVIGDNDLGEVADKMTNIMTAFKIQPKKMRKLADMLTKTFTSSNTDMMMLAESMQYVGPMAHASNQSIEDTLAMIGVLGNSGIQASMAGTTLRMMLQNIYNPNKKQAAMMKQLGVSTRDDKGQFRSLLDILTDIARKIGTDKSKGDDVTKNLLSGTTAEGINTFEAASKLFRVTAAAGGASLLEDIAKVRSMAQQIGAASGNSAALSKEKQNTIEGLWYQVVSAFTEDNIQMFEGMQGYIKGQLKGLIDWLRTPQAVNSLKTIVDMIKTTTEIFAEFAKVWIWFFDTFKDWIKYIVKVQFWLAQAGYILAPLNSIWKLLVRIKNVAIPQSLLASGQVAAITPMGAGVNAGAAMASAYTYNYPFAGGRPGGWMETAINRGIRRPGAGTYTGYDPANYMYVKQKDFERYGLSPTSYANRMRSIQDSMTLAAAHGNFGRYDALSKQLERFRDAKNVSARDLAELREARNMRRAANLQNAGIMSRLYRQRGYGNIAASLMGNLKSSANGFTSAFKMGSATLLANLGGLLGLLINPITIAVAAITALGVTIYNFVDSHRQQIANIKAMNDRLAKSTESYTTRINESKASIKEFNIDKARIIAYNAAIEKAGQLPLQDAPTLAQKLAGRKFYSTLNDKGVADDREKMKAIYENFIKRNAILYGGNIPSMDSFLHQVSSYTFGGYKQVRDVISKDKLERFIAETEMRSKLLQTPQTQTNLRKMQSEYERVLNVTKDPAQAHQAALDFINKAYNPNMPGLVDMQNMSTKDILNIKSGTYNKYKQYYQAGNEIMRYWLENDETIKAMRANFEMGKGGNSWGAIDKLIAGTPMMVNGKSIYPQISGGKIQGQQLMQDIVKADGTVQNTVTSYITYLTELYDAIKERYSNFNVSLPVFLQKFGGIGSYPITVSEGQNYAVGKKIPMFDYKIDNGMFTNMPANVQRDVRNNTIKSILDERRKEQENDAKKIDNATKKIKPVAQSVDDKLNLLDNKATSSANNVYRPYKWQSIETDLIAQLRDISDSLPKSENNRGLEDPYQKKSLNTTNNNTLAQTYQPTISPHITINIQGPISGTEEGARQLAEATAPYIIEKMGDSIREAGGSFNSSRDYSASNWNG